MTVNAELSSLKESYWDKKEAVVSTDALPAVMAICLLDMQVAGC
jgi:hypothetical protein